MKKINLLFIYFLGISLSWIPQTYAISNITILKINPTNVQSDIDSSIEEACNNWSLNAKDIIQFFTLSKEYPENPYHEYYQVPCDITGVLQEGQKKWNFSINGGATATWTNGQEIRYFGCNDTQCEQLIILPTDHIEPE